MDGDNVYVRADHPVYTAEQLIQYEISSHENANSNQNEIINSSHSGLNIFTGPESVDTFAEKFEKKKFLPGRKSREQERLGVRKVDITQNWCKIHVSGGETNAKYRRCELNFSVDQNLFVTNPMYKRGGIEYKKNCQRCVAAYEMRRRGYDVIAKPAVIDEFRKLSAKDPLFYSWRNIFKGVKFSRCLGKDGGKAYIINQMSLSCC